MQWLWRDSLEVISSVRVSSRENVFVDECLWIYNIDGMIHDRDTFVSKLFIVKVRCTNFVTTLTFRSEVVYYFFPVRLSSECAHLPSFRNEENFILRVSKGGGDEGLIFTSKFDFKTREWHFFCEWINEWKFVHLTFVERKDGLPDIVIYERIWHTNCTKIYLCLISLLVLYRNGFIFWEFFL